MFDGATPNKVGFAHMVQGDAQTLRRVNRSSFGDCYGLHDEQVRHCSDGNMKEGLVQGSPFSATCGGDYHSGAD